MHKLYTAEEIKEALDFTKSRILNGLCNRLIRERAEREHRFTKQDELDSEMIGDC